MPVSAVRIDLFDSDVVVWQHMGVEVYAKYLAIAPSIEVMTNQANSNAILVAAVLEQTQLLFGKSVKLQQ